MIKYLKNIIKLEHKKVWGFNNIAKFATKGLQMCYFLFFYER